MGSVKRPSPKLGGNGHHASTWPFPGWNREDLRMIVAVTTRWRQMWPHFEVGSGISDDGSPWVAITSVDGHTIVHIAKEAHDGPTPYVALYNNRTCHAKDLAGLLGWIAANQPDVLTIVRGEDDLQTWQNALLVG